MIYGADAFSQDDQWLAIEVYNSLVTGKKYHGINTFALKPVPIIIALPPTEGSVTEPLQETFPDSAFTDTFNLSRLDAVDLKGQYTIDYGRVL